MSSLDDTSSIERQRFFDGQRLFAGDLQRIEQFNREMRWLHNESLHQPGIGNGLAVTGHKGDREVVVAPGYAIDDLGREIVLTGTRTIPVQPVAGDGTGLPQHYVLTVQYPGDDDLEEVELREGICDTRGAVRLREEPIFCWVPLNPDGSPAGDQAAILTGRRLVLAEVAVRDCKLDKDISIVQRRNARPPTQPYIACGVEAPTPWEAWNPWDDADPPLDDFRAAYRFLGGLQAMINTSSGGFRTVPGYFARIDGNRTFEIEISEEKSTVLVDGQLSIVDQTEHGFRVLVIVLSITARSRPRDPGPISLIGRTAGGADGGGSSPSVLASLFPPSAGTETAEAEATTATATGAPTATGATTAAEAGAPTATGATTVAEAGAPTAAVAGTQSVAELEEGGEESSAVERLLKLIAEAWTVGWMGVEG
jgi:hypothetical protein